MLPGESMAVSLRGSYGEAFVVTDRRALVVREELPGSGGSGGIQVYAYPLGKISDALIGASAVGGSISLVTDQPPADVEKLTVYFPGFEQPKYEAAAALVRQLISQPGSVPVSNDSPVSPKDASPGGLTCPSCGAVIAENDIYCASCSAQIAVRCANCSSVLGSSDRYCTGCGWAREEAVSECPGCGKRAYFGGMMFCPDCGHVLKVRCASCGNTVLKSWRFCGVCGRQLDSVSLNPLTSVARFGERLKTGRSETRTAERQVPVESSGDGDTSVAAQHNVKGKELFEQDRVDEAIREFYQAVLLDPTNPTYHCNLAVAYDDKDMDDLALSEYQKTLELNPNDVTALLYLGYQYSEKEDRDGAIALWRKVIEIAPGSAEAQEAMDCLRHQEEI